MGRTRWIELGALLLLAAVAGLGCGAASSFAKAADRGVERVTFALPDGQGRTVRPEDFRGQVVLVDVWATWCEPCMISLPFYVDLHERLESQGLVILGVNVDEEPELLGAFLEEQPLPFTVLLDPRGTVPASLDTQTMPTSVLIGRDGQVLYVHDGFHDGEQAEVERRVKQALAARP